MEYAGSITKNHFTVFFSLYIDCCTTSFIRALHLHDWSEQSSNHRRWTTETLCIYATGGRVSAGCWPLASPQRYLRIVIDRHAGMLLWQLRYTYWSKLLSAVLKWDICWNPLCCLPLCCLLWFVVCLWFFHVLMQNILCNDLKSTFECQR